MSGMKNDKGNGRTVFVNNATIVGAESVSNTDCFKSGEPVDCGIKLTLEIGQSFRPEVIIAGNFKREGAKVSWGAAMKVKIFLNDMKVKWDELAPDNSIPQDILDQLIGLEIVRLQYPNRISPTTGKVQHRTYSRMVLQTYSDKQERTAEQFLREKYAADVAAGYVKPLSGEADTDFNPEHYEEEIAPAQV